MSAVRDLVLVAAGGLAREVMSALEGSRELRVTGLLDGDSSLWGTMVGGHPVIGGLAEVKGLDAALVVCAGKGTARRRIIESLSELGVADDRYATVVHPGVTVPSSCRVGLGSVLLAQVALTADVHVGRHVVVMPNATLTHDDVVEDFATICAGVSLGGGVRVGSGAYLGMNASVRQGLRVGADSTLGMGAVLLTHQPAGETWAGLPARPLT